MSHELIQTYKEMIQKPDQFNHMSDFARMTLVKLLIAQGEAVPAELENRLRDQLQDEVWQKLEK